MLPSNELRFMMERRLERMQRELDALKLLLKEIKWESNNV